MTSIFSVFCVVYVVSIGFRCVEFLGLLYAYLASESFGKRSRLWKGLLRNPIESISSFELPIEIGATSSAVRRTKAFNWMNLHPSSSASYFIGYRVLAFNLALILDSHIVHQCGTHTGAHVFFIHICFPISMSIFPSFRNSFSRVVSAFRAITTIVWLKSLRMPRVDNKKNAKYVWREDVCAHASVRGCFSLI